jgi:hypothetical protein
MKKMKIVLSGLFLLALVLPACKKNTTDGIVDNYKWVYTDTVNNANLRIIHCIASNTPTLPSASANTGPQFFAYINGKKLNGNALSYGGQWPSPSVYASVESGTNIRFDLVQARLNFLVVPNIPAPIAGDTLLTFTGTMQKGKYYSLYVGDSSTYKGELREDVLPVPAYQRYKIRLANWMMNPADTLTVYSRRNAADIITNISHKQVSDWVELDIPVVNDTFDIRKKGTTVSYVTFNNFAPAGLRMYTMIGRGKTGLTGKGASINILTNR